MPGQLALAVERQDHPEQAVELRALHALAEDEDVAREQPQRLRVGHVEVASQRVRDLGHERVLGQDRRDVLEHRLALVRVDAEAGDHVQQRVGVDVLLVRVAAEHELELGRGDELAHDADHVVADDALGGGEVADAHADDPAVDLGQGARIAPLLDVLAHLDVLGLPVVGLHRAVELVGPAVAQREQVERGRLASADDALGRQRRLGLGLVEHEGACAERVCGLQSGPPEGSVGGGRGRRLSFSPRTFQRAREQSTGLRPCGPLPLRDSAGISPDFAGIRALPRTLRAVPDGSQRAGDLQLARERHATGAAGRGQQGVRAVARPATRIARRRGAGRARPTRSGRRAADSLAARGARRARA